MKSCKQVVIFLMTLLLVTGLYAAEKRLSGDKSITDATIGVNQIGIDGTLDINSNDISAVGTITAGTVEINDSNTQIYESGSELTFKDAVSGEQKLSDLIGGGGGTSYWEKSGIVIRSNSTEVTYSTDDFVFGSPQLADDNNTDHDIRLLFDKSNGSFRAGKVTSTQWDEANRGSGSAAFGVSTKASGNWGSFAAGNGSIASSDSAVAMGDYCTASGGYSFSMGNSCQSTSSSSVSMGGFCISAGAYSFALGKDITVSSDYSFGIGLDETERTLNQQNTMAIMGGKVGIGSLAPMGIMDIAGVNDVLSLTDYPDGIYLAENAYFDVMFWKHIGTGYAGLSGFSETTGNYIIWNSTASGGAGDTISWTESLTIEPDGDVGIGTSTPNAKLDVEGNIYPHTNNAYYIGKNDDDAPAAWKGIILKDTTNGKYYRIEVISGVVTATDLTD